MAAVVQRFLFPRRHQLRWLPRGQVPHARCQGGGVSSRSSGGDDQNGGPDLRMFAPDAPPCSAWRGRCWPPMTRATPASLLWQAGRSALPRSDLCEPGRDGDRGSGADLVAPPRRQLGQAIGCVSRKRRLFFRANVRRHHLCFRD